MCLKHRLGGGFGWVMGPNFPFVTGWVRSVSWWVGSGWVKENRPTDNCVICPSPLTSRLGARLQFFITRFCTHPSTHLLLLLLLVVMVMRVI